MSRQAQQASPPESAPHEGGLEQRLRARSHLLEVLTEVQAEFIQQPEATARLFEKLLSVLLELTGSVRGFIGEVCRPSEGVPYVKAHAVHGTWTEELRETSNAILATGRPVESGTVLGLPFHAANELLGMVGIVHRPGGQHEEVIDLLQPFLTTCRTLLLGWRGAQQRRRTEEALRSQQEQLQMLALVAARTDNAVILTDEKGCIEWVNEGFTRLTGYTLPEVVGQKPGVLLQGPETAPDIVRHMSECLERGEGFIVELINYHRLGTPYWVRAEVQPLYDEQGRLTRFMAIESDITRRKQQEEELRQHRDHLQELVRQATRKLEAQQTQLIQSEKMASLGQMAAGIAHEINNPMSYITSNLGTLVDYSQVLLRLLSLHDEHTEALAAGRRQDTEALLERIQSLRRQEQVDELVADMPDLIQESLEGTRRVDEIIQGLKMFSRQDSGPPQPTDLNHVLESTLKLVRNQLKYKCRVLCDWGELPPIPCHPTQISQVFTNLLVNAAQSIQTQGEIRITTRHEGQQVVVSITDTGSGMTPETRAQLFTPFFTTKPPGKGTGLGLSISYSIISRHKGDIEVRSEPGQGSTFTVRLPVAPE